MPFLKDLKEKKGDCNGERSLFMKQRRFSFEFKRQAIEELLSDQCQVCLFEEMGEPFTTITAFKNVFGSVIINPLASSSLCHSGLSLIRAL